MRGVRLSDWRQVARGPDVMRRRAKPRDWPQPLPAHAGLWLDRLLACQKNDDSSEEKEPWPARRQLYGAAVKALAPGRREATDPPALQGYRSLFARYRDSLSEPCPGVIRQMVEVETTSRLLLHAASQNTVTEGSVLLHHTYGVPYLPGAALKGVVRARFQKWARSAGDEERHQIDGLIDELFGVVREGRESASRAAWVDFLDALWIPQTSEASPDWSPLALDIVNPHHFHYYTAGSEGRKLPTDSDEPIPVSRLTVAPGTRFLVVLEAADAEPLAKWLEWIKKALLETLEEDGIGSWTSAGYGRLKRAEASGVKQESDPGGKKPGRKRPANPSPPAGWQRAKVTREPGTGELKAQLATGQVAEASAAESQKFLQQLGQAARDRLMAKRKRRRPLALEVRVALLGRSWRIKAIRECE